MSYEETIIHLIREKIKEAQRINAGDADCLPGCNGWDVFDASHSDQPSSVMEIERCDQCCYVARNDMLTVWDDEVELLPEAVAKLKGTSHGQDSG